ncbi:Prolyl oligopeptidase family protein [Chitinophaga eiseniae]|uniref:Prolyl oligopeptidase family protein n=1 Tax=Chitinophaga eiseniae TaxID=634771 RepID=A0A1T4N4C3_9BACT|nr:prolyl oligopeptidase family serine peptidase [Chitinophaga eiseniae]SJZ74093.1 Prolyl oligopeptidase family protein [Chitinophaga eiseniae]
MLFWAKKNILVVFIVFGVHMALGQKKVIGVDDLGTWGLISQNAKLNDNGSALSYYINGKPTAGKFTAVLQSTGSSWIKEFPMGYGHYFTSDNRIFLCVLPGNEIVIQYLNSERQSRIYNVGKYSVWRADGSDWLAYTKLPKSSRELLLVNLSRSEDTIVYHQVDDYFLNGNGSCFVVINKVDSSNYSLRMLNIKMGEVREIYRGVKPTNIVIDDSGRKIAFLTTSENQAKVAKNIWYWDMDIMKEPVIVQPDIFADPNLLLTSLDGFSTENGMFFCTLSNRAGVKNDYTMGPSIWRYNSAKLESDLSDGNAKNYTFSAAWYPSENKIVQLQKQGETEIQKKDGRRQLLFYNNGYRGEWNWNENSIPSCVLVDMKRGLRRSLTQPGDRNAKSYVLSPKGNHIVYYDADMSAYFHYDIESGIRRNLTSGILAKWTTYDRDDEPFASYINIGVAGFSADESKVFIYSQYDIFEIDLTGKKAPLNLTNGYGKENSIVFRFAFLPETWDSKRILLTAFNRKTKENGFFEVREGDPKSLSVLTMENALFTGVDESKYVIRNMPVRAKDADVFVVTKMDAKHAPDLYVTRDFKVFKKLSDVHPEKEFNWLTTELIDFESLDGKVSQGILYKPEDFDPKKKYPLVFYYYEKISECLNFFINPDVSIGPVNIPYLVSNGYLVFAPDVHFEIGYPGRSSYNTVMGAANMLIKLPFVDSTKMGIQGHSFGGFQTNYIITHTSRFAAACSAAGFTNFVSAYGAVIGDGYSRQGQYELYRDRIGATLWARPDLYLENSPVLRIDKINTPLLMMHNKDDGDVPVEQGLEFFTGLRRLGKTAYLLQYKDAGHVVIGDDAKDYSKRILDFFNFYLKKGKLPSWMTNKPANVIEFSYPFHSQVVHK